MKSTHPLVKLLKSIKIDNVDRFLAAILTLNTIAHTVGALGAGAKATVVFGSAWFGLFSAIMTLDPLSPRSSPKRSGPSFGQNSSGRLLGSCTA